MQSQTVRGHNDGCELYSSHIETKIFAINVTVKWAEKIVTVVAADSWNREQYWQSCWHVLAVAVQIVCDILFKRLSVINKWCCRSWYPLSANCLTFQYFVLVPVSVHNAVSVQCPYSFAAHISNEYCWILMSGSLVLSADCIAAVECCITLCGDRGEERPVTT